MNKDMINYCNLIKQNQKVELVFSIFKDNIFNATNTTELDKSIKHRHMIINMDNLSKENLVFIYQFIKDFPYLVYRSNLIIYYSDLEVFQQCNILRNYMNNHTKEKTRTSYPLVRKIFYENLQKLSEKELQHIVNIYNSELNYSYGELISLILKIKPTLSLKMNNTLLYNIYIKTLVHEDKIHPFRELFQIHSFLKKYLITPHQKQLLPYLL